MDAENAEEVQEAFDREQEVQDAGEQEVQDAGELESQEDSVQLEGAVGGEPDCSDYSDSDSDAGYESFDEKSSFNMVERYRLERNEDCD